MKGLGFSRRTGLLLLSGGVLVALAVFLLLARLITSASFLANSPRVSAPVRFAGLPTPVVTRPQWRSYTYAGPIRDLALGDGLLWAATEGGVVVWDGTGAAVRFGVEHGLAANRVSSVAIGVDGAIWAGTVGGLSRYDGRTWHTFTVADGLPNDAITDLAVDRDGFVWAATTGGLARYDGDEWRSYSSRGLLAALPSEHIWALAVDSANRLWVATSRGLVWLERGRWNPANLPTTEPVQVLAAGPDDLIWGITSLGVLYTDGQTTDWLINRPVPDTSRPLQPFVDLAVASDGSLFASFESAGVRRFDPLSGSAELIPFEPRPDGLDEGGALLIDESGALWAGIGDTVRRFAGGEWTTLVAPSDLPSRLVNDLAYGDGAIWAASPQGVARFDGRWQTFGVADGLAGSDVRALAVSPSGTLWAAFDSPLRGLSRYGPGGWQTVTCPTAAPTSAAVAAVVQTRGAVWIATAAGVSRFDGVEWQTFDARHGLPDAPIAALAAQGETVWAASAEGIARFDGDWRIVSDTAAYELAVAPDGAVWAAGNGLIRLDQGGSTVFPPMPTTIRGLAAEGDTVWLATPDGALRYDGRWTVFTTADGLPGNDVTAIGTGEDGRVWAATSDLAGDIGVVVFDGQRWQPHPNRDAAAEQLASDDVSRILITPQGDTWLNTGAGLERYHQGVWSVYDEEDGLPGVLNTLAWAFGTVWAGGPEGLYRFDGRAWQPFGGTSPEQAGAPVGAMAVAPSGELWVGATAPSQLRFYDGDSWTVVALPSPEMEVVDLAFATTGQLLAVVYEDRHSLLGLYDGTAWTWKTSADLELEPRWLGVAPDGRLWITGVIPGAHDDMPDAVRDLMPGTQQAAGTAVAVFAVGLSGLGPEIGRFDAPDVNAISWRFTGSLRPFVFGPDGRVYVAGSGRVYVFDGQSETIQPITTIDVPLPFTRFVFSLAIAPDGRLWMATEGGVAVLAGDDWQIFYAPAHAPEWWQSAAVIVPRADGAILLGSSAGAVGVYTGRSFEGMMRPSEGPEAWAGAFPPITALMFREPGELWVGSSEGVARLAEAWQVFVPDATLAAATTALAATDDRLWLGTARGWATVELTDAQCRYAAVEPRSAVPDTVVDRQGAVWLATAEDGVFRALPDDDPAPELTGAFATMSVSPNGEVWFASRRQPWLLRYRPDGAEDAWSRLPLDLGLIEPLNLTSMAVAPALDLWLGGSGLVQFRGGRWSKLTTADGLADNTVSHVLVTPDGTVWVATGGGLSRYQP